MTICPHCGSKNVTWNWAHANSTNDKKWLHECLNCENVFETMEKVEEKK